jgi:hypothetical protein
MQQGVATSHEIGVEAGLTGMYLMIAENSIKAKQFRLAADAINDGFRFVKVKDEHAWEPELHRVKGELALEQFATGGASKASNVARKTPRNRFWRRKKLRARRDRENGSFAQRVA